MSYIILDCETAPLVKFPDKKPHPDHSLVYDFGYLVVDEHNVILEQRSFIIAETFFKHDIMNSAFYRNKLSLYDKRDAISFIEAWNVFNSDIIKYKVKNVWAYNCAFDQLALDATISYYSNGFIQEFIPTGCRWRDIWSYANCITRRTKFVKFCAKNNLFTSRGNPSTTAETLYRFISNDNNFTKAHTALADAIIEHKILVKCFKSHTKKKLTPGGGGADAARTWRKMNKTK